MHCNHHFLNPFSSFAICPSNIFFGKRSQCRNCIVFCCHVSFAFSREQTLGLPLTLKTVTLLKGPGRPGFMSVGPVWPDKASCLDRFCNWFSALMLLLKSVNKFWTRVPAFSVCPGFHRSCAGPESSCFIECPLACLMLSKDWSEMKWKLLSCVWLFVIPWTVQSMESSRPEYWSG